MHLSQVLDVIGRLLRNAAHPEIDAVECFGADAAPGGPSPAGLRIRYVNGALAYLWGAIWPGETDLPAPDRLPPPRGNRPDRAAVLVVLLLEVARPPEFRSWQLVALPDLGPTGGRGKVPRGLRIVAADGTSLLLRATAAGGPDRDPDEEPFPDWNVPLTISADLASGRGADLAAGISADLASGISAD
ncbi:hypothetical protein Q0Z83_069830 [Actinoplanes sichuanensis]|uniref:Uncharacterized protein n=1 Tax=Actinoplanes sichuanensis TaxID=512349 RepID=A0ABW4ACL2_9ACTN|nr:hypothetical protein [Actinoplanes sichuanensis]BEL08792.1 hypothetical protein Q0Z83_069830 [Actinoplanes sichuanensis]